LVNKVLVAECRRGTPSTRLAHPVGRVPLEHAYAEVEGGKKCEERREGGRRVR